LMGIAVCSHIYAGLSSAGVAGRPSEEVPSTVLARGAREPRRWLVDHQCAAQGENCSQAQCCQRSGVTCFRKNSSWSGCRRSCTPGVDMDDPAHNLEPWACADVEVEFGAEVAFGANVSGGISLLCFAVSRSEGTELLLILNQFHAGIGIFACDDQVLFSDAATEVPETQVLPNFWAEQQVLGALTASWVNTKGFMDAWAWIVSDGRMDPHDWVAKVDPDAVFFPDRLKIHLDDARFKGAAKAENGVYLKNCFDGPELQLYGSLEVLSSRAVRTLGRAVDNCRSILDYERMGEDMWLQRCLDQIGVASAEDYDGLVADGYCPGGPKGCGPQAVAFHPFKLPAQWSECYRQASGSNEMYW